MEKKTSIGLLSKLLLVVLLGAVAIVVYMANSFTYNKADETLPEKFVVYDARGEEGKPLGFSNPVVRIVGQTFELSEPANRFTVSGNIIRKNRVDGVIVQVRNVSREFGFPGEEHYGTSESQFPSISSSGAERTLIVELATPLQPGRYSVTLMGSTGVKSSEDVLREFQIPLTSDVYSYGAAFMCSSDGWTCQPLGENGEDFAIRITAEMIGDTDVLVGE